MSIALTEAQSQIVERGLDFAKSGEETYSISGLAGTGKTTTTIELIRELRSMGRNPAICTPTGKAAHVINSKQDAFTATTLHKVLTKHPYDKLAKIHQRLDELDKLGTLTSEEKEEERKLLEDLDKRKRTDNNLSFEPIPIEEFTYDMLVFDESSMIGKRETYDRYISRVPVQKIFVGDGGQLPPVKDEPAIDLVNSDARLHTILRQGADSGILAFAHAVYKGRVMSSREASKYPDLTILRDHGKSVLKGIEDHQIIVWTNKERHTFNPIIRKARGFDSSGETHPYLPLVGETIMCDANNDELRILRGAMLKIKSIDFYDRKQNPYVMTVTLVDDKDRERKFPISLTDMCPTPLVDSDHVDKKFRWRAVREGVPFRWPYVMTAHTAQGSEFDKVAMLCAMMPGTHREWKQWWYTAATRAKNELVVASYHYAHE